MIINHSGYRLQGWKNRQDPQRQMYCFSAMIHELNPLRSSGIVLDLRIRWRIKTLRGWCKLVWFRRSERASSESIWKKAGRRSSNSPRKATPREVTLNSRTSSGPGSVSSTMFKSGVSTHFVPLNHLRRRYHLSVLLRRALPSADRSHRVAPKIDRQCRAWSVEAGSGCTMGWRLSGKMAMGKRGIIRTSPRPRYWRTVEGFVSARGHRSLQTSGPNVTFRSIPCSLCSPLSVLLPAAYTARGLATRPTSLRWISPRCGRAA